MDFFKRVFGKKKQKIEQYGDEIPVERYVNYLELKEQGLENVLGKMHGSDHSIISFYGGGYVDIYFFLHHIPGTGFATMELLTTDGSGPKPNLLGTFELVAFTKLPYSETENMKPSFERMKNRTRWIFTGIARYSFEAVIAPKETCELPDEKGFLIFDNYMSANKAFKIGEQAHHLLLCMEIFQSEMNFAKDNGGDKLFDLLKKKGYYPYSDLDREPVA